MKILMLTNLLPYPLDNGGKIKTYNTLLALAAHNEVDLLCFYENKEEYRYIKNLENICGNVYCLNKKLTTRKNKLLMIRKAFVSLFSKYSFGIYKYLDNDMKEKINEIKDKYDYIYIDHLQLAVYLNLFNNKSQKIILDQHNCESTIIKRYFEEEQNKIKKLFLKIEYEKIKSFERNTLRRVDKVISLSKEDMKEMITLSSVNENKFLILPIIIRNIFVKDISSVNMDKKIKIMFLGTLTWYPNIQAIKWFLNNVFEEIKEEVELYIVGKDPDEEIIECANKHKNIIITGYVEDVNDYFTLCDIMIVPIFIGSGMRVKILEGLSKGIPIISTTIGCEGIDVTDNNNILIANDKSEFIEKIFKLKDKKIYNNISNNGRELFQDMYSFESLNDKLNNMIESLNMVEYEG